MPKPLLVSPAKVKSALAGRSMSRFIEALGATPQERDAEIESLIRDAQAWFESQCGVHLFETRIVTRGANSEDLVRRTDLDAGDYDKLDDAFSYHANDFRGGAVSIKLRKRPVLSIQGAGLRFGAVPGKGDLITFPRGWMAPEARLGYLHVGALIGGGAGSFNGQMLLLPMLGSVLARGVVPVFLRIDYSAGFLPREFNAQTDDLDDACPDFEEIRLVAEGVRSLAALKILKHTRFAKGAGGGNIAIDGISQNHTPGRFAQEIADLASDVENAKIALKGAFGGIDFMFA